MSLSNGNFIEDSCEAFVYFICCKIHIIEIKKFYGRLKTAIGFHQSFIESELDSATRKLY